jgi:hypothetical protein
MPTKAWTITFGTRTGTDSMVLYFADIYVGDRPSAYFDSFSGKALLEKVAAHFSKQEELNGFWE